MSEVKVPCNLKGGKLWAVALSELQMVMCCAGY